MSIVVVFYIMSLARSHFLPFGVRHQIKNTQQGIPKTAKAIKAPIILSPLF